MRSRPSITREIRASGRALHLIELANLCNGPRVEPAMAQRVWWHYQRSAPVRPDDLVVVAVAKSDAAVLFDLPTRVRGIIGPAGAGSAARALRDDVDPDWAARRFSCIVIASGNGLFESLAHDLTERGALVHLVSRPSTTSPVLRRQCTTSTRILLSHNRSPRRCAPQRTRVHR